jgi:hypothetical protein
LWIFAPINKQRLELFVTASISTEQETGRKWQMHTRWESFSVGNLWSMDVILGNAGNFYVSFLNNLAPYMWGNRYEDSDNGDLLYLPTSPHSVTNQKMNIDIFTAVRTSNLTLCNTSYILSFSILKL